MKTRVAIVGTREFNDYDYVEACVLSVIHPDDIEIVVSGGARGVDTLAKRFAEKHGLKFKEFPADWSKGKSAGMLRNTIIVDNCNLVIAFPSWKHSPGTCDTIRKAKLRKIPVHKFEVDIL